MVPRSDEVRFFSIAQAFEEDMDEGLASMVVPAFLFAIAIVVVVVVGWEILR